MTARLQINKKRLYEQAARIQNNVNILAVVKNNAYNIGLDLAFDTFFQAGIRAFATTSLIEAVKLRKKSDKIYIFLMNPSTEFETLRNNNIAMTLPSLTFYETYKNDLKGIEVHLEYKNLLRRSGFDYAAEMQKVLEENAVTVSGVWTHFAYADEINSPEYEVEKQNWLTMLDTIHASERNFRFIHAQNSASYMRDGIFPSHTHARLGILLYGSRPYHELAPDTAPSVITLCTNVIQTLELKQGESSGYSSAFIAENDCKIAICDIGYGDGVLRTRAKYDVMIHGKRYPIGALMMSHMLITVDQDVTTGDTVYLYNDSLRVDDYTHLGVGANSEQMSALNHYSLRLEITG
ncbi:alanine racemase [Virgibacillus phasianinus]|uniref:Alanine racemase n=1 Tax=Virgibacillus phasianinus TaxID=2017483 RepID=A0A220U756_9BACI|nr:alanine racemase [Virgibacillus phasianinus]ASK63802.1 alanine racemase [Virgibacillus phasianinus]